MQKNELLEANPAPACHFSPSALEIALECRTGPGLLPPRGDGY
jgi:hypothetical protein